MKWDEWWCPCIPSSPMASSVLVTQHAPHLYRVRGPARSPGNQVWNSNLQIWRQRWVIQRWCRRVLFLANTVTRCCTSVPHFSSEMTGSEHPNRWQSGLDVRWWVDDLVIVKVDKRRDLKLKFEILSYLGRTYYDPKAPYLAASIIHMLQGNIYKKYTHMTAVNGF